MVNGDLDVFRELDMTGLVEDDTRYTELVVADGLQGFGVRYHLNMRCFDILAQFVFRYAGHNNILVVFIRWLYAVILIEAKDVFVQPFIGSKIKEINDAARLLFGQHVDGCGFRENVADLIVPDVLRCIEDGFGFLLNGLSISVGITNMDFPRELALIQRCIDGVRPMSRNTSPEADKLIVKIEISLFGLDRVWRIANVCRFEEVVSCDAVCAIGCGTDKCGLAEDVVRFLRPGKRPIVLLGGGAGQAPPVPGGEDVARVFLAVSDNIGDPIGSMGVALALGRFGYDFKSDGACGKHAHGGVVLGTVVRHEIGPPEVSVARQSLFALDAVDVKLILRGMLGICSHHLLTDGNERFCFVVCVRYDAVVAALAGVVEHFAACHPLRAFKDKRGDDLNILTGEGKGRVAQFVEPPGHVLLKFQTVSTVGLQRYTGHRGPQYECDTYPNSLLHGVSSLVISIHQVSDSICSTTA